MTQIASGIIGISLGAVLVIGIQFACYKLVAWEDYHKTVAIAMSCVFLGILAAILIIEITT